MTDVSTTCAEAIFRVKWKNEEETSVSNEVEMSVTNNSPCQDSNHPDDLFQSRYVTPGFKSFSYFVITDWFFLASFIADRARCNWTGRSAVEVNMGNGRFNFECSRCR